MDNYTNINEIETNSSITQSETNTNITATTTTATTTVGTDDKLNEISKSNCCRYCCLRIKKCKFHSVIVYLLLLSLLCLFTQMIQGGYMAAVMTNLQTQFNLSTSKIGFILSSFDIMGAIATPLLSYIGSKYNKCRVLGVSGFFYVIGSVVYTLPYFIGERYKIPNLDSSDSSDSMYKNIDFCKIRHHTSSSFITKYVSSTNFSDTFSDIDFFTTISNASNFSMSPTTSITSTLSTSSTTSTTSTTSTITTASTIVNIVTSANVKENECSRDFSKTWPYAVFIIGQIFMSIGSAPLFSLGVTYLCDNLEERSHPLYTGIVYGSFALGPAIGYLMASALLSKWLYLDEKPPINDSDPKWVGCWFMGFLLAAGLVFVISILLLSFPDAIGNAAKAKKAEKKLKAKNKKIKSQEIKPTLETIEETNEQLESISMNSPTNIDSLSSISTYVPTPSPVPESPTKRKFSCSKKLIERIAHSHIKFKGLLSSFLKLILNFRYTLLVLIMSIECILVALFTNYMILYAQNVYQVSSSMSSILVGGVVVPSAILGAVVGGLIVKKFNLYIEGCVRLVIVSSCVTIGGIFVLLFIRCESQPSLGIDTKNQTFNTSFTSCNRECNCIANYNPVCGRNNLTYVSPCYAGCKIINDTGYFDCECISGIKSTGNMSTLDARTGICSMQCDTKLIIFLIVAFVVVFAETLSITPATMLILKIIDKPLQPFALGLLRCANILLAYIPAPIVLSQVIDKTCILWNNECQGDKGTCLEYNPFDFHFVLFGSAAGIKIVAGIFLIIFSLYIHKSYILRRKYRRKATLNHDPGSILTAKQKYRIDSFVASSETSSFDSDASTKSLYRRKKQINRDVSNVTLKKHIIIEDNYSLASLSQIGDLTNDKDIYNLSLSSINTPVRQSNEEFDNGLSTSNV